MGLNQQLQDAQAARKIELDFFVYNAVFPIATFVGAATIPLLIPITADSDFVLDAVNLVSFSAAGILIPFPPDYQIALRDTGSGRDLQDNPGHVSNVTGTGQFPYWLPEPKFFKGASNIGVTLTNNTAVAAKVDIAFIGRKIFYLASFNRDLLFASMY